MISSMIRHLPVHYLILLLAIIFTGCMSIQGVDLGRLYSATKNVANLGEKSLVEEQTVGETAASLLLEQAPLVDNPPLQEYVNRVGYWLAMQSERPDLPWRFGVIDNKAVNAFAAPGGYVFITTGYVGPYL